MSYRRRSYRRYYRPNYNGRFYRPRREINKYIKNVAGTFDPNGSTLSEPITVFGGTSSTESIATGTLQGLRWDIDIQRISGTVSQRVYWAIVIVREGFNPNALNTGNGANLYTPEQDVLAYGTTVISPGSQEDSSARFSDQTRTMRKVQQGDRLMLLFTGQPIIDPTSENSLVINATFQFFVKG